MTPPTLLRLGTRASALATTQSQHIADRLRDEAGVDVELVTISTEGDRDQSTPLAALGGQGVFVAALREAVAAWRARGCGGRLRAGVGPRGCCPGRVFRQ